MIRRKNRFYLVWLACMIPLTFVALEAKASEDGVKERKTMIKEQLVSRDIRSPRVLQAMEKVPRDQFVPKNLRKLAYQDRPLPIGHSQTISQPYIVAKMTQAADIQKEDRVLEIGTGSGYQAAILGELGKDVYTIEILEPLAKTAKETLERLGYSNVHVKAGDGYHGWPGKAPFDVILVTAAPEEVPPKLLEQLSPKGGRMIIPVGDSKRSWLEPQKLLKITRIQDTYKREHLLPVVFVPMTGEAQEEKNR